MPEITDIPPANLWGSVKQFFQRGGFVNGLNPTVVGRIWYVNGEQNTANLGNSGNPSIVIRGSDSNTGRSPSSPFATIGRALQLIDQYDIIVLSGVFREQVVAPIGVYDVTIIGSGNDPRQATNGGVATGGGSSWLAPASPVATTPLIRVICQGWRFRNLQMAPVAGAACITFDRRETTAIPDSSHGSVEGCYFTTGGAAGFGIEGIEVKRLRIEDCIFEALTGATGAGIKTTAGLGIAAPSHWRVRRNKFVQGVVDMNCLSLNFSDIQHNIFYSTNPIEAGTRMVLNGSTGRNRVLLNQFSDVAADVTIAKGYTPATSDVWNNYVAGTAALIVTVPT
jgi:hypothetical protein